MKEPDLIGEFEYKGHVDVEWYDVLSKDDIPDIKWHQVYIIGDLDGHVPIVMYDDDRDNLPGGRTEQDESIAETMIREIKEELNMEIISWEPLGYQKCTHATSGDVAYQFRAYAKLNKIDDFINDPGGRVIGYRLVEIDDVNRTIGYGEIGDRLISNAKLAQKNSPVRKTH